MAPVGFSSSPPSKLPCGGDLRRFNPEVVTRSLEVRLGDRSGFPPPVAATRRETDRDRSPLASWSDFWWPWSTTHDSRQRVRWWILNFSGEFSVISG
ncbi:hypothetical protein ACLB2K_022467 [Fragaria x ananassa]